MMTVLRHTRAVTLALFVLVIPASAHAQGQPQIPDKPFEFADDWFEQFMPMPSDADERALADVTVPRQDEQRLGNEMVKTYLAQLKQQKLKVKRAGKEVKYVSALVEELRLQMRNAERYPSIEVYLVESDVPDARSFPGGTLFFYRGLLDIAHNEAALVGVVGHELSHLDHGHQLLPLKQTRLFEKSLSTNGRKFDPWQFLESGTRMARLMSRPFRPQDEAAADEDAVTWACRAGYDPREFSRLLVRIHERIAKEKRVELPEFLRTHPPTLERAEATLLQCEKLKATAHDGLYIGVTNLKRRIPRSEMEFDD